MARRETRKKLDEVGDGNVMRRVWGLLIVAFVLRVAFLVLAGVNAPLTGDELAYQQIAEHFAAGLGLFQTNNPFFPGQTLYAWQAPLYPLVIGILYSVLGNNLLAAKLFGIVVSTATVYVMFDFARRVARAAFSENETDAGRIAFFAALLVAIYPGFLTNAHLLLSETLFIFLMLLAFDFVAHAVARGTAHTWWWIAGAGAMWGLATLTRGLTLYFTPLLALWVGWALWRNMEGAPHRHSMSQGAFRNSVVAALVFVAATAVVIVPWAVRNYYRFGQIVLVETKGGVNLWLGNSPFTPDAFIRDVWKVGVREPMLNALPQGELERDRAAYSLALNYIRSEPLTFIARVPAKFADFWGFERNLIDIADATTRGGGWNSLSKIGADALAIVVYVYVMLAGIMGFVLVFQFRGDRSALRWNILLGGFALYFMTVHLAIFGDGRFHLPLIPFFAMYAGWLMLMFRRTAYPLPRLTLAIGLVLVLAGVWVREMWVAWQILRTG